MRSFCARARDAILETEHLAQGVSSQGNLSLGSVPVEARVIMAFIFQLMVLSFGVYEIVGLIPFFAVLWGVIEWCGLPLGRLVVRALYVMPLVGLVGLANPLFDYTRIEMVGGVHMTGGCLSFFSLLGRCFLTTLCAFVLIASTGFYGICAALLRLRVPKVLVCQMSFVYRYLLVLLDEAQAVMDARAMRCRGTRGMGLSAWGQLVGNLLLRTYDRAHRIHDAMRCRGFQGEVKVAPQKVSWCCTGAWVCFSVLVLGIFRLYNITEIWGAWVLHLCA